MKPISSHGRKIKIGLPITLLALICLSVSFWFWRQHVIAKRAVISTAAIENGLTTGDFVSARSALPGLADGVLRTSKQREIRIAELKQALSVRDTALMRKAIAEAADSPLEPQLLEAAELELAREAIQRADFRTYDEFVGKWKSKSSFPNQWILLEADQLISRKLPAEALAFLKSSQLGGPEDALRYARIALLEAKEPWKAIAALDEGLKADPRNADILSFRAQIQEAAGRTADARLDYVAAVFSERKNPLHRDILANFYLRTGDLAAAADTWRDAVEDTGLGVYALKSWFWSRVSGIPLSKPMPPSRQEGWRELVAALSTTPEHVFWNPALDTSLSSIKGGTRRPEVIWLRLLESLRQKDFASAKATLDTGFPREAENLQPDLALGLLASLTAHDGKDARLSLAGRDLAPVPEDAHPFLTEFSKWASRSASDGENKSFETWLAHPNSMIGTLFASGWSGAALIIGNDGKLVSSPDSPPWFDYGYGKSLLIRHGKEPARKWLESLPARTPAADLFLGEIELTSGAFDQGLARLESIAAGNSPHASRAAWTIALMELDRGNTAKSRDITLGSPPLAESVPGKEILARVALAGGGIAETTRIYQELGEQSADAMIFLSKQAFAARDFEQARKWTAILARRFPEQPDFRQNLIKINEAEKLKNP